MVEAVLIWKSVIDDDGKKFCLGPGCGAQSVELTLTSPCLQFPYKKMTAESSWLTGSGGRMKKDVKIAADGVTSTVLSSRRAICLI